MRTIPDPKGGVGSGPTTQIQHHSMLVQTSFDSSMPGGGFGPHITGILLLTSAMMK